MLSVSDAAAVRDVRLVGAAELQVDVAVGDARQRRLTDDRARARAQRVIAVGGDRERDLGVAVGVSVDVVDLPTVTPETLTSLPLTSCAATKRAWTV